MLQTPHHISAGNGARARNYFSRLHILAKSQHPDDVKERARLRDELVMMHQKLVFATVRAFLEARRAGGAEYDDLLGEAQIGLCKAVDRFDPERGTEFSTYAYHLIQSEMRHHVRDQSSLIHEPAWHQERRFHGGAEAPHAQCVGLCSDENPLGAALDESDHAAHLDMRLTVRALLAGHWGEVPRRELEALRIYFYGDSSYTQVASRMDISISCARETVLKGIARLTPLLRDALA